MSADGVRHRGALALLAATLLAATAAAQDDVPRAPRLDAPRGAPPPTPLPTPAAQAAVPASALLGPQRPPNAATLAPLPEERTEAPEEIIVIGQGWRLPDLGSAWRERQAEAERSGRFHTILLPLYDPARPSSRGDVLLANPEARRQGYIELFRLGFGRRPAE